MKVTLDDIKILIDNLARKINAPQNLLPTYGQSIDGAHPHIEVDRNGQLYYVIVERGEELKRDFAVDSNDLLYRVFRDVASSMAVDFERNNKIDKEDCRRQIFSKQQGLLETLNKDWGARMEKEHQWILRTHPFDDSASIRANCSKQLTGTETANWRYLTIEKLEKQDFGNPDRAATDMIKRCLKLCKVQLHQFTVEDLRLMIGQEFSLQYLIPLAIEHLQADIFIEGDYYSGDLLNNVLSVDTKFWVANKDLWTKINELIKDKREDLKANKIPTSLFDTAK